MTTPAHDTERAQEMAGCGAYSTPPLTVIPFNLEDDFMRWWKSGWSELTLFCFITGLCCQRKFVGKQIIILCGKVDRFIHAISLRPVSGRVETAPAAVALAGCKGSLCFSYSIETCSFCSQLVKA